MKNNLILFFSCFLISLFSLQMSAQVIYVSSSNDYLYRLDLDNCTSEFVVNIQSDQPIFDISFHPNGSLYGISPYGEFMKIDTITGNTNIIHVFDSPDQFFNSLTVAGDGLVYTTGNAGELWSYDILNDNETYHGSIGYGATGDLTFYNGNLYVAVTDNRIVLVDIDNPMNSSVVVDDYVPGDIYGIVSFANDCSDVNSYVITDGNSDIYQIDFENNALSFVCELNFEVYGGASTFEFFGSAPIILDDVSEVNPSCGLDDGMIEIEASGGTGEINYSIDGVNFQTDGLFENLPAGIYTVIISDNINCTISQEVNLSNDNAPEITSISSWNATCGAANGSIIISAMGGTGQLEYSIDGINFQPNNIFDNLPSGDYTIIVQDTNACSDTGNVEVSAEDTPEITNLSSASTTCGTANGSITISATGGTGQLEYSIDGTNFQSNNTFDNLPSGDYTITIQDENGCMDTGSVEILSENVPEITDVVATTTTCGAANGSIIISAMGGTGQLEYSIDGANFQSNNTFDNLSPGNYTVTVRDEDDCTDTESTEVLSENAPEIIDIVAANATCGVENGSITITAMGGTGQLEYSIDGTNFQSNNTFENLPLGNYTITVQDENDCTDSENTEILSENAPEITDITPLNTTCGEDNGSISISITNGSEPFEYSIDGVNFQASNNFENLAGGNYTVIVQDVNNCQDSVLTMIEMSESFALPTIETMSTTCGELNGSIIIDPDGMSGNLEYAINGSEYQQSNIFADLSSGDYMVFVKDENDCILTSDVEIMDSPELAIIETETTPAVCGEANGGFTIEVEGGIGQTQISINGSSFQSGFSVDNLTEGAYEIQIMDEAGCTADASIAIQSEVCPVYIPNVFSPNNDGSNDVFKIYPHPSFVGEFKTFRVYDRWGALMYEAQNFDPENEGWDGTYRGQELDTGVYVYYVEFLYENGEPGFEEGSVTIVK